MPLTFKQLQDEVLGWLDEDGDTDKSLQQVKSALNEANSKRSSAHDFSFMVGYTTLQLIEGEREYTLVDAFSRPIYFRRQDNKRYLEEVPFREVKERDIDWSLPGGNQFTLRRNTLTLLWTPGPQDAGVTIEYGFHRVPTEMVADGDLPNIPYPFSRILVYDALIQMGLYNEDGSPDKITLWQSKAEELFVEMLAAFMEGRTVGAYSQYVHQTDNW